MTNPESPSNPSNPCRCAGKPCGGATPCGGVPRPPIPVPLPPRPVFPNPSEEILAAAVPLIQMLTDIIERGKKEAHEAGYERRTLIARTASLLAVVETLRTVEAIGADHAEAEALLSKHLRLVEDAVQIYANTVDTDFSKTEFVDAEFGAKDPDPKSPSPARASEPDSMTMSKIQEMQTRFAQMEKENETLAGELLKRHEEVQRLRSENQEMRAKLGVGV